MNVRSASAVPFVMLTLIAALTFWLSRMVQGEKPRVPLRHDPDYIVERFEVKRFDLAGTLQHTLSGDTLVHYPDDDTTVVNAPRISYHQGAPAEVSARLALVGPDGKEVDLVDQVVVVRYSPAGDVAASRLETRRLKVFPDEERGLTADPVTITRGRSVIRGRGLEIDNKTGITQLRGRVTGTLHSKRTEKP